MRNRKEKEKKESTGGSDEAEAEADEVADEPTSRGKKEVVKRKRKGSDSTSATPAGPDYASTPLVATTIEGKKRLRWEYRLLARMALVLGVMAVVYYNGQQNKEQSIGKHDEVIRGKYLQLDCKGTKNKDVKSCGRMITDSLILKEEVMSLIDLGKRSLKKDLIIDFYKASKAKNKKSYDFKPSDKITFQSVKSRIKRLISDYFKIDYFHIFLAQPCVLLRTDSVFPKSVFTHKNNYVAHIDLSQLTRDFTGGRFVFIDGDKTNRTVESRDGRVIVFSSGEENIVKVEETDAGDKISLLLGFTMNEKDAINDPNFNS